jgi:hypothetical protein
MLYTLIVQGIMMTGVVFIWKDRLEYITRENPNFGQLMVETTFIGALLFVFLSPIANLPESGTKAQYISSWTDYQVTKLSKLRIMNKR